MFSTVGRALVGSASGLLGPASSASNVEKPENAVVERNREKDIEVVHRTGTTVRPTPLLSDELAYYLRCCNEFGVAPDPSVATVLQNQPWVVHLLVKSREFGLKDMLPLGPVLRYNTTLQSVDLSRCDIRCNGVFVLKDVLIANRTIRKLNLSYNGIGRYGAEALGEALAVNTSIKCLKLRGNNLDSKSVVGLADGVAKNYSLRHLDVSNNNITIDGINILTDALNTRREVFDLEDNFRLEAEGNFWMEELVNSITHGVGLLLAIIFGVALQREATLDNAHPPSYYWSCLVFTLSLICLYTCSTLAHSFHRMKLTGSIFVILDHSCISILIAGSYTPFCMVTLGHMWLGTLLCVVVWLLAIFGVTVSLLGPAWRRVELGLFIFMGWMVLPSVKYIYECIDPMGFVWLAVGGLFYTVGVYFFVKGQTMPIYHAIWHLFVLAGSTSHYLAIFLYVRPCTAVTGVNDDSKMWLMHHGEL